MTGDVFDQLRFGRDSPKTYRYRKRIAIRSTFTKTDGSLLGRNCSTFHSFMVTFKQLTSERGLDMIPVLIFIVSHDFWARSLYD